MVPYFCSDLEAHWTWRARAMAFWFSLRLLPSCSPSTPPDALFYSHPQMLLLILVIPTDNVIYFSSDLIAGSLS